MNHTERFLQIIQRISKESGVSIPDSYEYRTAFLDCWKCNKEVLIFNWNKDLETPPQPMPKTVEKKLVKTTEIEHWVNNCPYCENIQGDFFIDSEPDSPMFVLDEIKNDKDSYEADVDRMAKYYFENIIR